MMSINDPRLYLNFYVNIANRLKGTRALVTFFSHPMWQ